MRAYRTLPLVVGLAWGLSLSDAQAAPPGPNVYPLHVLELATDDADDQAKALSLALRARVRASKDFSLADGDFALGVFLAQLKCGDVPDVNCQGQIAEKLKAERYVWGTMRKSAAGQVTADIHLWQRNQPEIRQQISFGENMTVAEDPALQKLADQVLGKMSNSSKVGTAKLSGPHSLEGDLFVDGQGQGKFSLGSAELQLPIGDHQFEVRANGKVLAKGAGKVGPGNALELELIVLEKSDQAPAATTQASWKKPASYAAIGVGGALILTAGFLTISNATGGLGNSELDDFKKNHVPKGKDACSVARNPAEGYDVSAFRDASTLDSIKKTCDRGDTFKTAQFVMYPLGALLAAGGGYLLYSMGKEKGAEASKRRIEVSPMVGQRSGFVDLRVSFLGPHAAYRGGAPGGQAAGGAS